MPVSPSITHVATDPVADRSVEFVERKGIGHPDTLCDGIAEAVSRTLSRYYRREFGEILHHNTDKVHLGAGRANPAYGGGIVHEPLYVLVGGRATMTVDGTELPIQDLVRTAAEQYLLETVPQLDPGHVTVECRIGRTSQDLKALFERDGAALANDTSVGVGHAPGTRTERYVRTLEPRLHEELEAVGKDVKLMALRREDEIAVTIAAAVIDKYVDSQAAYCEVLDQVRELAKTHAREMIGRPVSVYVNEADDYDEGTVYLTTTGLSAEAGDDGAVGRGNRTTGLITPFRPMSLEAAAGKNPVTHVGKLYNVLSVRIAEQLANEYDADYSSVELLGKIGDPVTEPWAVDVTTTVGDADVTGIVQEQLDSLDHLREDLLANKVQVF